MHTIYSDMGRRNETNRLAHKKKVDQKKTKEKQTERIRKEKLQTIYNKLNNEKESGKQE